MITICYNWKFRIQRFPAALLPAKLHATVRTTKFGKRCAHEVFAHVGRPQPAHFELMAAPSGAARGLFCYAFI